MLKLRRNEIMLKIEKELKDWKQYLKRDRKHLEILLMDNSEFGNSESRRYPELTINEMLIRECLDEIREDLIMSNSLEKRIEKIKEEGSATFIKPRMDEGKAKFPSKEDIVLESLRTINLHKKE